MYIYEAKPERETTNILMGAKTMVRGYVKQQLNNQIRRNNHSHWKEGAGSFGASGF